MNTVDNLISIAQDEALEINRRKDALEILARTYSSDDSTHDFFNQCFSSGSNELRRLLIGVMDKNDYPHLANQARELLNEDDNELRHEVIRILGRHGAEQDLELISTQLDTHCFTVNYAARQAMNLLEKRLDKSSPIAKKQHHLNTSFPNLADTSTIPTEAPTPLESCPINGCVVPPDSEQGLELPVNNNPANSLNLLKFFDDLSDEALNSYQHYYKTLRAMPPIELRYDEASRRLHIIETDLQDDINHYENSIHLLENQLDSLHQTNGLIESEIRQAKREESNFWNSLMTTLSSSHQEKLATTIDNMQDEFHTNQAQIEQLDNELHDVQSHNKALLAPLIKARAQQGHAEAAFHELSEQLDSYDQEINQLILRTLRKIDSADIASRLSFLNDSLLCPELTEITVEQIKRLSLRLHEQKRLAEDLAIDFNLKLKESTKQFPQLGKEISLSLPLKQHQKQHVSTLKSQLHFDDKHQQIKGMAEGEGRIQSSALIEELEWRDRPELTKEIKAFATHFHQLGISSAQNEWAAVDVISTDSCLMHYLDTIRLALETDFIRYRHD